MRTDFVTCKACKEKIDRDLAYQVGTRSYYCSEAEYLSYLKNKKKNKSEKKSKKKTKKETLSLIFEVFEYEVTNTLLTNELKELAKIYTYDNIYSYIQDNFDYLNKTLNGKRFDNEWRKIKYFSVIVKNHIKDYLETKKEAIKNTEYIKNIEYDIPEVKYKNIRNKIKYIKMRVMKCTNMVLLAWAIWVLQCLIA